MENFVILFIVALLCVCSCSCSLLDSLGKGVPPPVLKPKTLNGVPTVSDTPAWANWTWESWLYGPPCPQDYRDVPPIAEYEKFYGWKFGVELGIVYNGEIIFLEGAGTISDTSTEVPDGNTIWNIGSVTKIFTSFLLMQALDDGVISLTDPVTKFFNDENPPIFAPKNPYGDNLDCVCMHSLATHTSGIGREPPCGVLNIDHWDYDTIFSYINQSNLLFPPFEQPHYSNLGVTLLGRSIERAYGGVYEDLLVEKILAPLQMNSSGFNYTTDVKNRMAVGYTLNYKDEQTASEWNYWDQGFSNPCGGMYSSVSDILKCLSNAILGDGGAPVRQDRIREYLMAGVMMPDGLSSYGFGTFENVYANGFNTFTKGGLTTGFGTSIAFIPELKLGMACVINFATSIPDELLADSMMAVLPALLEELAANQAAPELPQGYEQWLGSYGTKLNTILTIQESGTLNVLNGTLFGVSQSFTWDQVQQETSGFSAAFRMVDSEAAEESCQMLYSNTKDAVAYFHDLDGSPTITIPDQAIWDIPKIS